ncbi:uncharacterized protein LOC141653254 [Silene latifolia]|uniref:uncharacterized protein LOC141653254 n=1 Tax=Silene latifolia TaxID=37657 RepID=UPI003D772A44
MEPRGVVENDAIKRGDDTIPVDRLGCSSVSSVSSPKSASSDFSFDDSYPLEINEHGSFALTNEESEPPATPGGSSTLETPSVQVMERPPDESGYRIPAHVFAKSSNPNPDWSTASNESLFSIHTGNMSFTRDQFSWLKSGELGTYGGPGDIRKSGELPPPSPRIVLKSGEPTVVPLDTHKSGEQVIANHFKASSTTPPVVNRPADVEVISQSKVNEHVGAPGLTVSTRKDDLKPEMKDQTKGRSSASDEVRPSTCVSPHHSDASGQSFAFPVLADMDKDKSVNSGQSRAGSKNTENADQEGPKTPTSAPTPAPSSSWFSRFSCCSCCVTQ